MKVSIYSLFVLLLLNACGQAPQWKTTNTLDLGDITPIGLTFFQKQIWISDGDNNRVVSLSTDGKVDQIFEDFERPMHLSSSPNNLYIPEYGSDQIILLENGERKALSITDSLDAPASVAIFKNEIAIADFYNHRILFFDGKSWKSFGKKGKAAGEFHYPTDVQLTDQKIYVADAYNNRVQVFDKSGNSLQILGEEEKMNAATGLYVSQQEIFITDFENDRVLIYSLSGELKQTITEGMNKPTDVLQLENKLYIANYKGQDLVVYER